MDTLSVIVPTRERPDTLLHTLRTLQGQDYDGLEIIVSDNASGDATREVVKSFSDPRVTYVNTGRRLSMSDSWEFALGHARGDFVAFLGDDDGYLPGAVPRAMGILRDSAMKAIVWDKADYCWPDHIDESMRNWIVLKDRSRGIEVARGQKRLRRVMAFHESYARLPCLYSGIVRRTLVDSVVRMSTNGRFFNAVSPDVYSGIALSMVADSYLLSAIPFSVNGASRHSNGTSVMRSQSNDAGSPAAQFASENLVEYDPRIRLAPSTVVFVLGEYLLASRFLPGLQFPEPDWNRYVRALIKNAAGSFASAQIINSAAHTARLLGMRISIPDLDTFRQPLATGLEPQGNSLAFKAPSEMVANVYDACRLIGSIVSGVPDSSPTAPLRRFLARTKESLLFEAKNLYRSV